MWPFWLWPFWFVAVLDVIQLSKTPESIDEKFRVGDYVGNN